MNNNQRLMKERFDIDYPDVRRNYQLVQYVTIIYPHFEASLKHFNLSEEQFDQICCSAKSIDIMKYNNILKYKDMLDSQCTDLDTCKYLLKDLEGEYRIYDIKKESFELLK